MSSVVISEFEVVAEPPRPQGAGAQEGERPAQAPAAPTPHEIAQSMRRLAERQMRVRAS